MTVLKDLLTQVADEARHYDGTERAVRALRRRRAAVRLAPVAAALLVVAAVAASTLAVSRDSESGPTRTVGGLPSRLSPANSPPELPSDRGVGPASLAYLLRASIEDDGEFRLVTTGGRQYALPRALRVVGMSPDGRWVLWAESDRAVLRDLTGTEQVEFPAPTPNGWISAVWSPDGRRLVVQIVGRPASVLPNRLTAMVDLEPVVERFVPLTDNHYSPCAVRNSGVIILCPRAESSSTNLRLVDGATGRTTGEIDVYAWLRPGEGIGPIAGPLVPRPDDATLLLPLLGPGARTTDQSDIVAIDLDEGRVTARYPLPNRLPPYVSKAPDGTEEYGESDRRELAAAPAEGVLLVHISPRADDPMSGRAVAIEMVAPETGALTVVTRVFGDIARILLPGGNY
jgi:hypothetical protein